MRLCESMFQHLNVSLPCLALWRRLEDVERKAARSEVAVVDDDRVLELFARSGQPSAARRQQFASLQCMSTDIDKFWIAAAQSGFAYASISYIQRLYP